MVTTIINCFYGIAMVATMVVAMVIAIVAIMG